jgi:hypothetical protein
MMFALAGFQIVWSVIEFTHVSFFTGGAYSDAHSYLWLWGIWDLIVAAVAIYAGVDILQRGVVGRVLGIIIAGLAAIRWLLYLPMAPWLSITVIAVTIIVICVLFVNGEYFTAAKTNP